MDFLILGPIEARNAAGVVALGGNKPRAVLTVLLLHANRPVSADRLALALWGEDAPGGAVKTVQVHVSRLRKALGDADAIDTTAAGYTLRVRDGELDAARFEGLVEDGRAALDAREPEDAVATLRAALALWRGPALAELALEPFAAAEITRLEEERLAAQELCIEAELAAGRHAEVVGELQRLVLDQPTREGLAGQLMLALYRCGRQTDALEAFAAVRRVLVEEIGVEPGPLLQARHQAILRQDAALQPEPDDVDLPQALDPSSSQPLVGRDDELDWLLGHWERARTGAGGVVALVGPRGSGKSRLTAELAREIHGPGVAVVYATGEGPADRLFAALRRARATSRPMLLVVDEVDRAGVGVHDELARLAEAIGHATVLLVVCATDGAAVADLCAVDTLELGALDEAAVRTIAAAYAPAKDATQVPAGRLLHDSGGIARRVHEVSSQWARREALQRVGEVANRAQAGRERQRTIQDELAGGVEELQAADERLTRAGRDDAPIVCPYKGLASFDVADARYFFGRERLVAELVARLVGASLLGVVGPSGSGKSSVLRAGLLPALAGGVLPGSDAWAQMLMRPGEHPLRELGEGLARVSGAGRTVIAVDQFEETFTTCSDEHERAEFIAELGAAAADRDGRFVVVIALRADFYGRCAAYRELAVPLAANHVLVPSMQRDELRRAIVRPADRVGLSVDPELSDALVADVNDEPGALPLLQTALLELWQRRDGRRLRYGVYEQSGGVRGAVARLAEDAFGQLDERRQLLARGVLLRLAGESEEGGVERRRVPIAELELDGSPELGQAVALLTDRRLLTASAGSIELAHEALLREWPRLRDWIQENRDGLRIHRNLGAAAREWQALERDDGALYRGARLAEALEWMADGDAQALNEVEGAFLAASRAAAERERLARRRRLAAAFGGLAALLVGVAIVAAVAISQRHAAQHQRDLAASRVLAGRAASVVGSDPRLSLAIGLAAWHRQHTDQAAAAVREAAFADRSSSVWPLPGAANSIAASPDGHRIVTASEGGEVVVHDVATGRVLSRFQIDREPPGVTRSAISAAFSRDGRHIASGAGDGGVIVSDALGRHRMLLTHLPNDDYAASIEYDRAGDRLLIATENGEVGFLRTDRPSARLEPLGSLGDAAYASFDASTTKVVGAAGSRAVVWDLARRSSMTTLRSGPVVGASLNPRGTRAVTAGVDGVVRIFDAANGRLVRKIPASDAAIGWVRFDRDGRRIVTSGADGVVRVFAVTGGPPLAELKANAGATNDALFVPDSNLVASVGEDPDLRTWDVPAVRQLFTGPQPGPAGQPSVHGSDVVSGYDDGAVRIWHSADGAQTTLPGFGDTSFAKYSGDGHYVISASFDQSGVVRLWDAWRGLALPDVPTIAKDEIYAIAIDRSGARVAVATLDHMTIVEAPNGTHRMTLDGPKSDLDGLDFSPDGKLLAGASEDGSAYIWDTRTGTLRPRLPIGRVHVLDDAFSPDNRRLATAGADGVVRIWPVAGGSPMLLYGAVGAVNSVAFDPTGRLLVTAGHDGQVRVWDARRGVGLLAVASYRGDAPGAAFIDGGRDVVSAGEREQALRITACELCGSFADVLRIAHSRAPRVLSPDERRQWLSSNGG